MDFVHYHYQCNLYLNYDSCNHQHYIIIISFRCNDDNDVDDYDNTGDSVNDDIDSDNDSNTNDKSLSNNNNSDDMIIAGTTL